MTGPHNRTCGARAVLCGITDSVLQGMRMRGELNKPGARPYLSAAETLVVMGCAGANASVGLGVNAACLRLQLATAINTSGKRAQQAIAQAQREGQ